MFSHWYNVDVFWCLTVVQSYAGCMSLSVTAEKWAVPDADEFLLWVMEEYERLRVAAGVQN
jgi:hypothetical protein